MRVPHTWASRAATVATAALAVTLLVRGADLDGALAWAALALGVLSLAATAKMIRDNCFESRLAAVVLAALQLLAALLAVTVGLPGADAAHTDPLSYLAIGAGTAVLAFVALDARLRASR